MKRLIDVYVYRMVDEKPEFLFLKRSAHKIYPNQWRLVHGKVEEGEAYWQAAVREFNEETQLSAKLYWVLPTINSFYEAATDTIHHIPAFAIEVENGQDPILNDEHTAFEWATIEKAKKFITWPEQKRLLRTAHDIVNDKIIQPEWILKIE